MPLAAAVNMPSEAASSRAQGRWPDRGKRAATCRGALVGRRVVVMRGRAYQRGAVSPIVAGYRGTPSPTLPRCAGEGVIRSIVRAVGDDFTVALIVS